MSVHHDRFNSHASKTRHDNAINRRPGFRIVPQEIKLDRESPDRRSAPGIHAFAVRLQVVPCLLGKMAFDLLGDPAQSHNAEHPVKRERDFPEDLRKTSGSSPALEVHLPEPVLCVHESHRKERVMFGPRRYAGNAIVITEDVRGILQRLMTRSSRSFGERTW